MAIVKDAEKLAADNEESEKFHSLRAKEDAGPVRSGSARRFGETAAPFLSSFIAPTSIAHPGFHQFEVAGRVPRARVAVHGGAQETRGK